jgi:transcriptional regulator with XRE-family HTH domain
VTQPDRELLWGWRMRDYDHLCSALYASRLRQALTLAEVAERLGGHLQHVSRSLRGDDEMRGRRLFALADALGYDLALVPREDA